MAFRIRAKHAGPIGLIVIAAAATVAQHVAPTTATFEGVKTVGYIDRLSARKVPTVCAGQTGFIKVNGKLLAVRRGMKVKYADCIVILQESEMQWAIAAYRITPGITDHPRTWGAVSDFIHQYGEGMYASSGMARGFNRGFWASSCSYFMHYTKAGRPKRVLPGLVRRSRWRTNECLADHGAKA